MSYLEQLFEMAHALERRIDGLETQEKTEARNNTVMKAEYRNLHLDYADPGRIYLDTQCEYCGRRMEEGYEFCQGCGAPA